MSYLFVAVIGAVVGWLAGQNIKGGEHIGIDIGAATLGAIVLVLLIRLVGPDAAAGYLMSTIVSVIGAIGSIFGVRQYQKTKMAPATRPRTRR